MGHNNGTVVAPVSFADVNYVLSSRHTDLGNLCKDANINMWAKYKPVRLAVINTLSGQWDATNNKWLATATWWKAGGDCGLAFTGYSSLGSPSSESSFLGQLRRNALAWTYNKVGGGTSQPYRLQDFAGYLHTAMCPIGDLYGEGTTIFVPTTGQGLELSLSWDNPSADEGNLAVADFSYNGTSFKDFYLAVMMWKSDSNYFLVSSDSKIGTNSNLTIVTTVTNSDLGTYNVYPFLSSVKITRGGTLQSGAYLSALGKTNSTITLAASTSMYIISVYASFTNSDSTEVGFTAQITNSSSSSKTFSGGITFRIFETNTSTQPTSGSTPKYTVRYSTNFTVSANSTYTLPASIYREFVGDYFSSVLTVTAPASGKMYWANAIFYDGTSTDFNLSQVEEAVPAE